MDPLDQLTNRVQQAAREIIALKNEKQELLQKIEALRDELKEHQSLRRTYENMQRGQDRLRAKLERINERISKFLIEDIGALVPNGGNHENSPQ